MALLRTLVKIAMPDLFGMEDLLTGMSEGAASSVKSALTARVMPKLIRAGARPEQAYQVLGRYGVARPIGYMAEHWNKAKRGLAAQDVVEDLADRKAIYTQDLPAVISGTPGGPRATVRIIYHERETGMFRSRPINVWFDEGESKDIIRRRARRAMDVWREAGDYQTVGKIERVDVMQLYG